MTAAVDVRNVDIIFGPKPDVALKLLDGGSTRDEILAQCKHVLGVAGASISVEKGEICVLMGLSGSGKSTLLRAINGLNRTTRGQTLVAHEGGMVDVASCAPDVLRALRMRSVAMVFQGFALLPWRTVAENVGFGLELRGMGRAERDAIVRDKLKMVSLDKWADKHAHELSGGMQQRVGLARAFATDADILLMDEPFSALDPLIRSRLQDDLLELQDKLNKTIVFVSHDLDEAVKLGDHIAIMESGRIVQHGAPEDIVLHPSGDYVADFVRHMNPMGVLKAGSVMKAADRLESRNGALCLDPASRILLTRDAEGKPTGAWISGAAAHLTPCFDAAATAKLTRAGDEIAVAPISTGLRAAVELRDATGNPVVLVDDAGVVVGVCGDDEIYGALLRQNRPA